MKFIALLIPTLLLIVTIPLTAAEYDWDSAIETHHGSKDIKVYRNPNCNCCHKWIKHLEKHEFNVIDMLTHDMASVKETVQLPKQMSSCHTAVIDGYIIEGHVPADDIKRLLRHKPDIAGLSVPKMPVGTPGMEMGERKDDFAVFSFTKSGKIAVFNQYQHTSLSNSVDSEPTHKH
ncbi:MAG: copper amine oxidase [Gammaproteobacteria bacterium]|nr:MAG: copper amine oxidase [Gammaproteobacteria bacterium]